MKRAKWKGFYANTPVKNKKKNSERQSFNIASRNSVIVPKFINKTFHVHNGKQLKKLVILDEMSGHKFGEFFKTRATFEYKKKKKKKKK